MIKNDESSAEERYLLLSDDKVFHTIEGEGRLMGRPSVFLRLFGCNLTCKGWASEDSPFGCDTFISWSKKNKFTFDELISLFVENGYVEKLRRGDILKITGGEPLLRQKPLIDFIRFFQDTFAFVPRIDFETNGTIMPFDEWMTGEFNVSWTTSPKLSTNGDPVEKTYKPDVIRRLVEWEACFKFVVTPNSNDIEEIFSKYIVPCKIPQRLIWLMVCAGSRKEHVANAQFVAELCKMYGFNFSPRLQLVVWDMALKV